MEVKRKIIEIDEELCDGCGQCVPACAEGAVQIVDEKAKLVSDKYCDGLGACLGECPNGAITMVEREAEEFDEEAVEEYLSSKVHEGISEEATLACGCPSTQVESFIPSVSCQDANELSLHANTTSALSHWPVQIRLVPASAPFLKGADLLVAAHCTSVAYPNFHHDFIKGKVAMMGCPKFDDVGEYIQKFADIFGTADIMGITVVVMEVPCCSALPIIVREGMEASGKGIPVEEVMISTRGEILKQERFAA